MSSYAPVGPERGLFDGAEAPMRAWLRADLSRVDRGRADAVDHRYVPRAVVQLQRRAL